LIRHPFAAQLSRKDLVGAIVHQDLMQRVAGGDDYAEMANRPVRHFMRPPSPVVDESESAGILKMLLLHRQAVLVRIGGKVGGIVTWMSTSP
jgi:predicted transcriptional regulator